MNTSTNGSGKDEMMLFPGESKPVAVPDSLVASARKESGAVIYKAPSKPPGFVDALPTTIGLVGAGIGRFGGRRGGRAKKGFMQAGGQFLGHMAGKGAQELYYRTHGFGDAPGSMLGEIPAAATEAGLGAALPELARAGGVHSLLSSMPRHVWPEVKQGAEEMIRQRIPIGGPDIVGSLRKIPGVGKVVPSAEKVRKAPIIGPYLVKGSGLREGAPEKLTGEVWRNFLNAAKEGRKWAMQAKRAGMMVPRGEFLKELRGQVYKFSRGADFSTAKRLVAHLNEFRANLPSMIDPEHAYQILIQQRQKAIQMMASARGAAGKQFPIPSEHSAEAMHAKELADAATRIFRNAPGRIGEGFRSMRKNLSNAIAAKELASAAHSGAGGVGVLHRAGIGALAGGAIGTLGAEGNEHGQKSAEYGAILALAMTNPALASRIMLTATDPAVRAAIAALPAYIMYQSRKSNKPAVNAGPLKFPQPSQNTGGK